MKYLLISLFLLKLLQGQQSNHPFLLANESDLPTLREKANSSHFEELLNASRQKWNDPYNTSAVRASEAIARNTFVYLASSDPSEREKHKDKFYEIITSYWPTLTSEFLNSRSHGNTVYGGSAQFNAYLAFDFMYDDFNSSERTAIQAELTRLANAQRNPTNNTFPWALSLYGINIISAIWDGDRDNAEYWRGRYDSVLNSYIGDDGTWFQSSGYVVARMFSDRISKGVTPHVLDYHNFSNKYSERARMKSFARWTTAFAFTPHGASTVYGDTGNILREIFHRAGNMLPSISRYDAEAGKQMQWILNSANREKPHTGVASSLVTLLILHEEPVEPKMPESLLMESSGAALWGKLGEGEAVQGILKSMTKGSTHQHQNANAITISGYGQHLLTNAGTRYRNAAGNAFNYPGYDPNGDTWRISRKANVVIIGDINNEHSAKEGDGLTAGMIDRVSGFGKTIAIDSLGNGVHTRTLRHVQATQGENYDYFLLFDEVKPDNPNDKVYVLMNPNTKSGDVDVIKNNEYMAPVSAYVEAETSNGTEALSFFYNSSPNITIRDEYKGSFGSAVLSSQLVAEYSTNNGMVHAGMVLYPSDASHPKPEIDSIQHSTYDGALINHSDEIKDIYLTSDGSEETTYDGLRIQGKTIWGRQIDGRVRNFAVTEGAYFYQHHRVGTEDFFTGFTSKGFPINIQMNGQVGYYEASQDTTIALFGKNIIDVKVDGVSRARVASGNTYYRVNVPAGKHEISFLRSVDEHPSGLDSLRGNELDTGFLNNVQPISFESPVRFGSGSIVEYQWYKSSWNSSTNSWGDWVLINGANSNSYTPEEGLNVSTRYRVEVSDSVISKSYFTNIIRKEIIPSTRNVNLIDSMLSFKTRSGFNYEVEKSSDLATWSSVKTYIGSDQEVEHLVSLEDRKMFFRVNIILQE